MVRGNYVPFVVNKQLQKAIYTRTRLKNKYTQILRKKTKQNIKSKEILCIFEKQMYEKLP